MHIKTKRDDLKPIAVFLDTDGRWYATGVTQFNPEPHVLCQGETKDAVLRIIQSVYGTIKHVLITNANHP